MERTSTSETHHAKNLSRTAQLRKGYPATIQEHNPAKKRTTCHHTKKHYGSMCLPRPFAPFPRARCIFACLCTSFSFCNFFSLCNAFSCLNSFSFSNAFPCSNSCSFCNLSFSFRSASHCANSGLATRYDTLLIHASSAQSVSAYKGDNLLPSLVVDQHPVQSISSSICSLLGRK